MPFDCIGQYFIELQLMVLLRWDLLRYARCYENRKEQYSDHVGRPLFDILPFLQQCTPLPSQVISDLPCRLSETESSKIKLPSQWSAINAAQLDYLRLEIDIKSCDQATLSVSCRPTSQSHQDEKKSTSNHWVSSVKLEAIEFPPLKNNNGSGFKVSPRETSLGFRYISKAMVG